MPSSAGPSKRPGNKLGFFRNPPAHCHGPRANYWMNQSPLEKCKTLMLASFLPLCNPGGGDGSNTRPVTLGVELPPAVCSLLRVLAASVGASSRRVAKLFLAKPACKSSTTFRAHQHGTFSWHCAVCTNDAALKQVVDSPFPSTILEAAMPLCVAGKGSLPGFTAYPYLVSVLGTCPLGDLATSDM